MASIRHALRGNAGNTPAETIRILVPVTGSDTDAKLLSYVGKIAQKKQAFIILIYVVEVEQALPLDADLPEAITYGEHVLREAQQIIQQALDSKSCSIHTDLLQARSAGAAIVDEVSIQNADLIIMSTSVSKRMGKRTCGETTDTILRNAPCEVVILRGPMSDALLEELHMETEAE
ncbi:MAG: universal stress protein [Thermomicrobiales bacterium]|nr:universal stress protein [Thermomicrobiales bacterium]MCO5218451.1 universal stress protein [Thermomicrobiales bacterium]MCO5223725.1 universal stress protein [Thermomicrobiales bacterium]